MLQLPWQRCTAPPRSVPSAGATCQRRHPLASPLAKAPTPLGWSPPLHPRMLLLLPLALCQLQRLLPLCRQREERADPPAVAAAAPASAARAGAGPWRCLAATPSTATACCSGCSSATPRRAAPPAPCASRQSPLQSTTACPGSAAAPLPSSSSSRRRLRDVRRPTWLLWVLQLMGLQAACHSAGSSHQPQRRRSNHHGRRRSSPGMACQGCRR